MGFFDRFRRKETETRSGLFAGLTLNGAGFYNGSRPPVPAHLAENLSAVLGCVELICGAVSSLPPSLVTDMPEGRMPAPSSAPAWRLLQRPNSLQSWPAFVSWMTGQILLHGNALAFIETDGRGGVAALKPAPWPWLLPVVLSGQGNPRLAFDVIHMAPESALLGLPSRLLDTDVLHVRARSDFGALGRSVLSRAAGPVAEGIEIASVANSVWANGLRPSGIYSIDGQLDADTRKRFRDNIREMHAGPSNAGKIMILDRGGKFTSTSMSSLDAEFLASRQFSVSEICRLFSVPEVLMQVKERVPADPSAYLSLFASQCLAPLVAGIESEFDTLLPVGQHLQLDLSGMLRGSFATMTAAMCASVQSGIATPNDGRRALGLRPHADGDMLRVGPAPSWPADATGLPHLGPSPGPTAKGGLAEPGTHQGQGAT